MKVKAFIERGNDGSYGVYVDLEDTTLNYGIIGDGKTVTEAIDDFHNSYKEMKDSYASENKYFEEAEFEFKYDVPSVFNYFNEINLTTFSRKIGVNSSLLRQYKNGLAFASKKQAEKIINGLHELGKQLSSAQL